MKKFVVQVRDPVAVRCWNDDVLPGMEHEFDYHSEANEAVKTRKKLSPDYEFRVHVREVDEDVFPSD